MIIRKKKKEFGKNNLSSFLLVVRGNIKLVNKMGINHILYL